MSGSGSSAREAIPASDAPSEQIAKYNSKTFEAFLEDLSKDRNVDEIILKGFSENKNAMHRSLFDEISSKIGYRKKKLNICIEAIEKYKEKLIQNKTSKEIDIRSNENEINYTKMFLLLAKEELQREELYKDKAMKIILAKCSYHGFEKEED